MKTLKVNGMHCGHCKAAAKELRFEESGPVDLEALKTAIRDIGFDPE